MAKVIGHDHGREFVGPIAKSLSEAFGIKFETSHRPGNPNARGSIEVQNKQLKAMLWSLCHRMRTTRWHLVLPLVKYGMATTWKRKLNATPFEYDRGYACSVRCDDEGRLRKLVGMMVEADMTPTGDRIKMGTYYKGLDHEDEELEKELKKRASKAKEELRTHPKFSEAKEQLARIKIDIKELGEKFGQANGDLVMLGELSSKMAALMAEKVALEKQVNIDDDEAPLVVDDEAHGSHVHVGYRLCRRGGTGSRPGGRLLQQLCESLPSSATQSSSPTGACTSGHD